MTETEYKEAYEQERSKSVKLAAQVALLQEQNDALTRELSHIRNHPLWRASAPVRKACNFLIRQIDRLKNCGSIRGVFQKLDYKRREKAAKAQFGTASFPSQEEARRQREESFPRKVKISILTPVWNNSLTFQKEMMDSVMNQTYENWELCLADGSDEAHGEIGELCREYAAKSGGRIVYRHLEKNEGISGNTNAALQMATGDYIGLLDQDDILHPSVLYEYVRAINEQNADYLYCDEITFCGGDINRMLTMHFKPDYAPDNLRANNYICHFSVFARELLDGAELFRTRFDGSQDHDMILRLTDRAKKVVHIPRPMYYWRSHEGSVAAGIEAKPYAVDAAKGAVADHLKNHGFTYFEITSTRAFATIFRIQYQIIGNPKISIIIPNRDHETDLRRCISSILLKTTYENYEIIVVENNSTSQEIAAYYQELSGEEWVKLVKYQGAFNYSAVNNLGVSCAEGEYVLLLNNDTEVISPGWLEELLMYAQRQDVGAVGAKLYYEDRTIQHAGVILGLGAHRTAGHGHYRQEGQNLGYMGRLCYAQDVSAVTGACLMVKKSLYQEVGGLDESFVISLNDVDFCLKLRDKGLLNVWTPFAELYHYESKSRGGDDQGENAKRYQQESDHFREKWKEVLEKGDPYYNPNFSLDRSDFSLKTQGA